MELSIKLIIVMGLSIMVLTALSVFLSKSSGEEKEILEAQSIFSDKCSEYMDKDCAWELTFEEDFSRFIQACKTLYGEDGKFTCFFTRCCNPSAKNLNCEARCKICEGMNFIDLPIGGCCTQFRENCQINCNIC